jgi:hypothetical protein
LNSTTKDNHTDSFDNIFSREEIENMVEIARDHKLVLTEPIDFSYKERIAYCYSASNSQPALVDVSVCPLK